MDEMFQKGTGRPDRVVRAGRAGGGLGHRGEGRSEPDRRTGQGPLKFQTFQEAQTCIYLGGSGRQPGDTVTLRDRPPAADAFLDYAATNRIGGLLRKSLLTNHEKQINSALPMETPLGKHDSCPRPHATFTFQLSRRVKKITNIAQNRSIQLERKRKATTYNDHTDPRTTLQTDRPTFALPFAPL